MTASGYIKEYQNPFANQGKTYQESGKFVKWINYFIISVRKIARAYIVHILIRNRLFLAHALDAPISTYLFYDLKHNVPVSFR